MHVYQQFRITGHPQRPAQQRGKRVEPAVDNAFEQREIANDDAVRIAGAVRHRAAALLEGDQPVIDPAPPGDVETDRAPIVPHDGDVLVPG